MTFRYDRFDPTGAVSTPGSYAFLMPDGHATSVVTTYEQLRTESTVMRVNVQDEHGASWATFYDAVVVGDVFEWRQADDCWTRYRVTVAPQPAGGAVSRELGVRWVTYAARGCTGAISGYAVASLNLNPPLAIKSSEITVPVRHGPYLLVPSGWTGDVEDAAPVSAPSDTRASSAADASPTATTAPWEVTFDLVEARRHPYWRDPELPGGWTFAKAEANYEGIDGYVAFYLDSLGGLGLEYQVARNFWQPRKIRAVDGMSIHELRLIDGRPAVVRYSPSGNLTQVTKAFIFDEASGIDVIVVGVSPGVGGSPEIAITVARSLLPEATATPPPTPTETPTPSPTPTATPSATATATPTTFRYDTFDTTGAVSTPGSYAFLMPDGHATSVVTTYEQLRTEASVIRVNVDDEHGASWATFYGEVEVGDVVAWYETDDCWTRYRTTSTPQPAAGSSVREFGVEWFAYAGTGCAGAISTSATISTQWDPPVIASRATGTREVTVITSPIRYGAYLLIPSGWDGAIEPHAHVGLPTADEGAPASAAVPVPEWPSDDIDEVRRHPLWRAPVLPVGWTLTGAYAEDGESLSASYRDEANLVVVTIARHENRPFHQATPGGADANIWEARTIDGHPAVVWYDPQRSNGIPLTSVKLFDEATTIEYFVTSYTGGNIDATIEIARSLLPE